MPKVHSADVDRELELEFACPACGASGRAVVYAEGSGASTSILGVGESDADTAALAEARADAHHQAKVTLGLARCPRCKHRSRMRRLVFLVPVLIGALLLLSVAGVLALWIGGVFGIGFAALLGLTAIGFTGRQLHRLSNAETYVRRVTLRTPEPPRAIAIAVPARRALPPPNEGDPRLLR